VVDNGGSATISCPDGSSATVADGADGADGNAGTNNHVVASHFCQGTLQGTPLSFTYHAAITAAGDVFVNASIKDALIEVPSATFYAAGQNGAALAAVIFEYDSAPPANGGTWMIELNRTTMVVSITYTDADVSGGSDAWTMLPSACITNTF
jgi:hypothetical protein